MPRSIAAYIADIIGLRNVLTHDYAGIDDEAIYGVATQDLILLRQECVEMLETIEDAGQAQSG